MLTSRPSPKCSCYNKPPDCIGLHIVGGIVKNKPIANISIIDVPDRLKPKILITYIWRSGYNIIDEQFNHWLINIPVFQP